MRIHLVNPSDVSFGIGVITPRWLYVLAQATPLRFGDPIITDETLDQLEPSTVGAGDVVGIGIHTGNALRGYQLGKLARDAGALVVFGGIHATLFPEEAHQLGGAHAVVKGDGDLVWATVLDDFEAGRGQRVYEGGRVEPEDLLPARWDLMLRLSAECRGPPQISTTAIWRTRHARQPGSRALRFSEALISR